MVFLVVMVLTLMVVLYCISGYLVALVVKMLVSDVALVVKIVVLMAVLYCISVGSSSFSLSLSLTVGGPPVCYFTET